MTALLKFLHIPIQSVSRVSPGLCPFGSSALPPFCPSAPSYQLSITCPGLSKKPAAATKGKSSLQRGLIINLPRDSREAGSRKSHNCAHTHTRKKRVSTIYKQICPNQLHTKRLLSTHSEFTALAQNLPSHVWP